MSGIPILLVTANVGSIFEEVNFLFYVVELLFNYDSYSIIINMYNNNNKIQFI